MNSPNQNSPSPVNGSGRRDDEQTTSLKLAWIIGKGKMARRLKFLGFDLKGRIAPGLRFGDTDLSHINADDRPLFAESDRQRPANIARTNDGNLRAS